MESSIHASEESGLQEDFKEHNFSSTSTFLLPALKPRDRITMITDQEEDHHQRFWEGVVCTVSSRNGK